MTVPLQFVPERPGRNGPREIRAVFKRITTNFCDNTERWLRIDPVDVQHVDAGIISELSVLLSSGAVHQDRPLSHNDGHTMHDFRGRVAMITNAISLLRLVRDRIERRTLIEMIGRNLRELTQIVNRMSAVAGCDDHRLMGVLNNTSEKLGRLLTIPMV